MKIGLICDGVAEYETLPGLLSRCGTPHQIVVTLKGDIQPLAPAPQVAKAIVRVLPIHLEKKVDHVVVILDLESPAACAVERATEIAVALRGRNLPLACSVVVKNRAFENWLIADPAAIDRIPKRFRLEASERRRIMQGQADNLDAQKLLKRNCLQGQYEKRLDARRILDQANPENMALHSRSFRKLMRELGAKQTTHRSR